VKFFFVYLGFGLILISCGDGDASSHEHKRGDGILLSVLGKNDRVTNDIKKTVRIHKVPGYCLGHDLVYKGAEVLHGIEDFIMDKADVRVSDEEVNEFGDDAMKYLKKQFVFVKRGRKKDALDKIFSDLLRTREEPSDIHYQLHYVDDTMMNAFTVGGHVFITTGIVREAGSVSAVASILGHEIAHNECGHIKSIIRRMKVAKIAGKSKWGEWGLILQNFIFPSYNQPNEVEADLYGMDMCYAAGFDPREVIYFWEKLSRREYDEGDWAGRFVRSHPYSKARAVCLKKYLKNQYGLE